MIKTLNTIEDVIFFLDYQAAYNPEYFKAEILKLEDGRWRVGIITEQQIEMELPIDDC